MALQPLTVYLVQHKNILLFTYMPILISSLVVIPLRFRQELVIHIESPKERDFTLGQFFDIWRSTGKGIPPADKEPTIYVNGNQTTTKLNDTPLHAHDEIVLVYGNPPSRIPAFYQFPEGEWSLLLILYNYWFSPKKLVLFHFFLIIKYAMGTTITAAIAGYSQYWICGESDAEFWVVYDLGTIR